MKRRNFLNLSVASPLILNNYLNAKDIEERYWFIIQEVQNILFPKTSKMPSAKMFGSVNYLKENVHHESFDKNDAEFIIQGSIDFFKTFPEFLDSNKDKKLLFVKEASETEYGNSWLSKLVYYGIEAMLSDPIYGGNKFQSAWIALNHKPGIPRPKKKYGAKVDL